MTYSELYEKLVLLSLMAPTDEIRESVLTLQIALDNLEFSDDDVGLELNAEMQALFEAE